MSTQATYDDANLILRLYELRREEKLRAARAWFVKSFKPATLQEAQEISAPGSEQDAYVRMVLSYWDMVASFITSGILNFELFAASAGELLFVWTRIRKLVPEMRAVFRMPRAYENLEKVGQMMIDRMNAGNPETYANFEKRVNG
jgi:L-rhamnose mutarotase